MPADTEYDVERFRLSIDRQGILDVEFAEVVNHLELDVGVWLGYADDPLNVYRDTSDGRERVGSIVSSRLGGNLVAALGLFDRFELGIDLPLVLSQKNDLGDFMSVSGTVSSFGLGDLRVIPKFGILQGKTALSLSVNFTLPTSTSEDYFGNGRATFAPELLLSRRFTDRLRAGFNIGYRFRKQRRALDLEVDDEIFAHLGIGFMVTERIELDGTFSFATAAEDFIGSFNRNHSEVRAGAAIHLGRIIPFVAAGIGTSEGFGTPDWRALIGVRLGLGGMGRKPSLIGTIADTDDDGINDDKDQCPNVPETFNGTDDEDGCPEQIASAEETDSDSDSDGINDANDKCLEQPEDLDGFEDLDGCPDLDNDNDGVLDTDDRCINNPGTIANDGCPDLDSDGDGIVDRLDNCPQQPGVAANQGCKKKQLVKLIDGKIEILDQVFFRTNRAIIRRKSYRLLNNVASVLNGHSELRKIRIEGHTDSRGNDNYNLKLSQRRADAVRDYLIKKGVAAERLEAVGYGETQPIETNETREGRASNRRVVFNLLGQAQGIDQNKSGPTEDTIDN